jgi:RHS repeat-associated protein
MTGSYSGCTSESGFDYSGSGAITAQNQISSSNGYTYDAAGSLHQITGAGAATYTYDAENHLTSTAGVTYSYDGDGKRVMKSSGEMYWYGLNSVPQFETDLNNNFWYAYMYFNGERIARRAGNNEIDWYQNDALGNTRAMFEINTSYYSDYYPFGGEKPVYGDPGACPAGCSSTNTNYKFTGKELDAESGLYNSHARFQSPSLGRFMSPDPANAGADPSNPQSWNMYSYVLNNPLDAVDPTGLWCVWDDGSGHDPDPSDGGWDQPGCEDQGGHWDPTDTITNLWSDSNGNITNVAWAGGIMSIDSSLGITTSNIDDYLAQGANPNIPTIGPASKDCSFLGRLWSATHFNPLVGVSLEGVDFGTAELAGTYHTDTQSWTADSSLKLFNFGPGASRLLSYGTQVPSNTNPDPTFSFDTPSTQTDMTTGQTKPASLSQTVSRTFKLGVSVIGGLEMEFDSAAFAQSGAVCSQ